MQFNTLAKDALPKRDVNFIPKPAGAIPSNKNVAPTKTIQAKPMPIKKQPEKLPLPNKQP
jgi:hypothetical protein